MGAGDEIIEEGAIGFGHDRVSGFIHFCAEAVAVKFGDEKRQRVAGHVLLVSRLYGAQARGGAFRAGGGCRGSSGGGGRGGNN